MEDIIVDVLPLANVPIGSWIAVVEATSKATVENCFFGFFFVTRSGLAFAKLNSLLYLWFRGDCGKGAPADCDLSPQSDVF